MKKLLKHKWAFLWLLLGAIVILQSPEVEQGSFAYSGDVWNHVQEGLRQWMK